MLPSSEKFSLILIPLSKLASYYFLSYNKLLFPFVTCYNFWLYIIFVLSVPSIIL